MNPLHEIYLRADGMPTFSRVGRTRALQLELVDILDFYGPSTLADICLAYGEDGWRIYETFARYLRQWEKDGTVRRSRGQHNRNNLWYLASQFDDLP